MNIPVLSLWKLRSLVFHFAWLNIKIRYKGAYLGLIWTALEPALIFTLLFVVFSSLRMGIREDFGIYLLTGIIIHSIFSKGTGGGLLSLATNQGILVSSNIRREFFPVSATAGALITIFIEIGVFFVLMLFFNFIPPWTIVFLPLVFALLLVLIQGFSYFLSVLYVLVKDIHPIWGVIVLALFFLSPIFWHIEDASEVLLGIHALNPVGQLVELGHKIVIDGEIPPLNDWLYASLLVGVVFFIGYAVFRRFENTMMEEL